MTAVGRSDLALHSLLVCGTYLRVPVEVRDFVMRVGELVVLEVTIRILAWVEDGGEDVSTLDDGDHVGGEGDCEGQEGGREE